MSISKRTFSAFVTSSDEETEVDWIEKKQLVQDFRKLSIDEAPFVSRKIRSSTSTASDLEFSLGKLKISAHRTKSREKKNIHEKDENEFKCKKQNQALEQLDLPSIGALIKSLRENHDFFALLASKTPSLENALVPYIDHKAEYLKMIKAKKHKSNENRMMILEKDSDKKEQAETSLIQSVCNK